jgi:hypothetical protein
VPYLISPRPARPALPCTAPPELAGSCVEREETGHADKEGPRMPIILDSTEVIQTCMREETPAFQSVGYGYMAYGTAIQQLKHQDEMGDR